MKINKRRALAIGTALALVGGGEALIPLPGPSEFGGAEAVDCQNPHGLRHNNISIRHIARGTEIYLGHETTRHFVDYDGMTEPPKLLGADAPIELTMGKGGEFTPHADHAVNDHGITEVHDQDRTYRIQGNPTGGLNISVACDPAPGPQR